MGQISILDEPLRAVLLIICISGTLYAFTNWLDARSDLIALKESAMASNAILMLVARGAVDDQRNLSLAQTCIVIASVLILTIPIQQRDVSINTMAIFLSLLMCSALLAFKSFRQSQRRKVLLAMVRAARNLQR